MPRQGRRGGSHGRQRIMRCQSGGVDPVGPGGLPYRARCSGHTDRRTHGYKPTELTDSIHEGRRPTRIENPPSKGEIKKLRERLSTFGRKEGRPLTEEMCVFLSEHVIAPASVRAQLQRPSVRPSPSGNLEIIYATVLVDALIPDPGNGRVVGATAWPAADKSPGQTLKLWAPSDVHVHPESSCEVLVQADNVTEFKTRDGGRRNEDETAEPEHAN